MNKIHLIIVLVFLALACSPKNEIGRVEERNNTTIFLVRHAEKVDDGSEDPPLTEMGIERAQFLKDMLSALDIDAIYSTPFQRNINTVKPLAESQDIEIIEYDQKHNLVSFITKIKEKHAGDRVLICGHSTTIPDMLNILIGDNQYENLQDENYNDLFLVYVPDKGKVEVINLKFEPLTIFK